MEERRTDRDRRSNWTQAIIALRLPDSYLMLVADTHVDLITDGHGDRETARQVLLDVLYLVRARAGAE